MFYNKPTVILRHRKENKKKCSLKGLELREDMRFFEYPKDTLPDLTGYVLLDLDGPPLTKEDKDKGIFLIDATWKYASKMYNQVKEQVKETRRIPKGYYTSYPRKQTGCCEPDAGLASIEALYISYKILGKDTSGLLDHYYWKKPFLEKNNLLN